MKKFSKEIVIKNFMSLIHIVSKILLWGPKYRFCKIAIIPIPVFHLFLYWCRTITFIHVKRKKNRFIQVIVLGSVYFQWILYWKEQNNARLNMNFRRFVCLSSILNTIIVPDGKYGWFWKRSFIFAQSNQCQGLWSFN